MSLIASYVSSDDAYGKYVRVINGGGVLLRMTHVTVDIREYAVTAPRS